MQSQLNPAVRPPPPPSCASRQVVRAVLAGERLQRPKGCPRPMYELMRECWRDDSVQRPTFAQIALRFRSWRDEYATEAKAAASAVRSNSSSSSGGALSTAAAGLRQQQPGSRSGSVFGDGGGSGAAAAAATATQPELSGGVHAVLPPPPLLHPAATVAATPGMSQQQLQLHTSQSAPLMGDADLNSVIMRSMQGAQAPAPGGAGTPPRRPRAADIVAGAAAAAAAAVARRTPGDDSDGGSHDSSADLSFSTERGIEPDMSMSTMYGSGFMHPLSMLHDPSGPLHASTSSAPAHGASPQQRSRLRGSSSSGQLGARQRHSTEGAASAGGWGRSHSPSLGGQRRSSSEAALGAGAASSSSAAAAPAAHNPYADIHDVMYAAQGGEWPCCMLHP